MNIAAHPFHVDREQELLHTHCAVPFSFLGLQDVVGQRGLLLRVWRPDANRVQVIEYPSGKPLGIMKRLESGLFELHFPRRRRKFHYELKITTDENAPFRILDPYQFGEYALREEGIDYDALYRHQGAHLLEHAF